MILDSLVTDRLLLRKWMEKDIKPFVEMNQDPEVMKYFPKTLSEKETLSFVERITTHFDKHHFGLFVLEDKASTEFVGFTGLMIPSFESDFIPCVEIGWRLRKEFWGKGIATEAANACLKFGFETLNLDKIVSFTAKLNTRSEKVMQRLGMSYVKDFDHPKVDKDSMLCRHVLYELTKEQFSSSYL
ncbi:GNAT family N-acetyltransferase [Cytophagaceae bacterium YF14B1]|uniref:GNAT family N-acetyltransferase n=1 Tax=Xanthocytophaga flava TaxID=3048013 RepID=A0AAE3U8S7_9BACT|nr:GNAT family N-acetyltransferase [Xanthocytophaga flavus]MDJ1482957.1 GNAT family N-acetyltransferase [Xanthocytophaga flavus]